MNSITLVGRLVRDVEMRTTSTGKNYCTFTIAVNKRIKPTDPNERDADFFNCKAWGKTADYASGYLAKGSLVSITGSIGSRKYTDKEGVNREVWEVNADQVNGLDRKATGEAKPQPAGNSTAPPVEHEYDPFAD